jgi:hypothetical protein
MQIFKSFSKSLASKLQKLIRQSIVIYPEKDLLKNEENQNSWQELPEGQKNQNVFWCKKDMFTMSQHRYFSHEFTSSTMHVQVPELVTSSKTEDE